MIDPQNQRIDQSAKKLPASAQLEAEITATGLAEQTLNGFSALYR